MDRPAAYPTRCWPPPPRFRTVAGTGPDPFREAKPMPSVLRTAILVFAACLLLPTRPQAAEKAEDAPIKVGVIGLDNYQALAFTELFHNPKATGDLKGIRVVAAFLG